MPETSNPTRPPSETLLLTRHQVAELLSLDECITAVEDAFRAHADGQAIPPAVLSSPVEGGAFHVKAAGLTAEPPTYAAKLNGNFYDNAARFGLPRIQGLIVLCDARNGRPLAVLDSTVITGVRTGAATAVAARYLARPDSRVATIWGCGLQGRTQLASLAQVLPLETAFAYDADPEMAARYAEEVGTELGIEVRPTQDGARACRESDVCVTCTPSNSPLLGPGDLSPGTFIAAVGADSEEKQELAPELLAQSRLVVDDLEQCASIGELHHALESGLLAVSDVHAELYQVVGGQRPGRQSPEEIVVFDSTGVALQDVAAAALVVRRARERGVGTALDLLG